MSVDLTNTITLSIPRRQRQQRFQTVDDDNDDVSLVGAGDAPEIPYSPPPYSVEDEAIAPGFRPIQILEEEHIGTNSNLVDAVPSLPPPYSLHDPMAPSESLPQTLEPIGARTEHSTEEQTEE